MRTTTLHTNEYLKAHSTNEGICLTTLSRKIGKLLDHMMTGAVIILVVTVVTVACIKVGQAGIISALYCDVSTEVVFVP